MAELYGVDDELPPDLGDEVLEDEKPVGDTEDTATADEADE
jgi:hypothetical protein